MTDDTSPTPHAKPGGDAVPRTPEAPDPHRGYTLDARDKKIAVYIESRIERRMTGVFRQESGDSYAGLPADHVLVNLNNQFPEVHFPERMMARLEAEQHGRLEHERRQDEVSLYEAETRRLDAAAERKHLDRAANRAVVVLLVLLAVGVGLTLAGYPGVGGSLMGVTLVGVVVAFISGQFKPSGGASDEAGSSQGGTGG